MDPAENGSYIGIPILLLLGVGLYRFRRDGLLLFSMTMAGISLLLSMGSYLHVWGHRAGIPLPFAVIAKLPFVQSEVASRYTLFMWFFIGVAVAVILDRARRARPLRRKLHSQGRQTRRGPLPLVLTLTVLGVLSLVPAWPYNISQVLTPPALVRPTVDHSPVGSTLLTYPLAKADHSLPMVWQAIDRFQYRIPSAEAIVADRHEGPTDAAFESCWLNPDQGCALGGPGGSIPCRTRLLARPHRRRPGDQYGQPDLCRPLPDRRPGPTAGDGAGGRGLDDVNLGSGTSS